MQSENAAARLPHANRVSACQLVAIDLLAATVECWAVFIAQLTPEIRRHEASSDERSRLRNLSILSNLSTATRDLDLAIKDTFRFALSSFEKSKSSVKPSLEDLGLELFSKSSSLTNRLQDLRNRMEAAADIRRSIIQENQTLAVKRLTLLAAIFLPISLAASLLSMTTRTVDLGVVWYDYFGLSFTLISAVFFVYCCMRGQDDLRFAAATKWASWLGRQKRNNEAFWKLASALLNTFVFAAPDQLQRRGPFWQRAPIIGVLCAVLTASFWVGMTVDIWLGLRVLGYSIAGSYALLLLITLIYQVTRENPPAPWSFLRP